MVRAMPKFDDVGCTEVSLSVERELSVYLVQSRDTISPAASCHKAGSAGGRNVVDQMRRARVATCLSAIEVPGNRTRA